MKKLFIHKGFPDKRIQRKTVAVKNNKPSPDSPETIHPGIHSDKRAGGDLKGSLKHLNSIVIS